jgi:hypothetical protein
MWTLNQQNVNVIFNRDLADVSVELMDVNSKIVAQRRVAVRAGEKITLSSFGQKGNFIVIVKYDDKILRKKLVII